MPRLDRSSSLVVLAAGLCVALLCDLALAAEEPQASDLQYVRKATREATRKATLEAHDSLSDRQRALLEYRLDTDFPRTEEDRYYRILRLPLPDGVQFEPGSIEIIDEDTIAVCTRIGDIYFIDGAYELPPSRPTYRRFASGLHEPLGLARRGDWLYVVQRTEVTRIKDLDEDGRADLFETVSDGWGHGGDYHEYAFGSKFDASGNIWIVLCLTGSFSSQHLFRGWALTVSEDGVTTAVASGIRSPGGVGRNAAGDFFYTDNQGPWNGTCILRHVKPGSFLGHPAGNRWYDHAPNMGERPEEPKSGSRFHVEKQRIPELMTPTIFFPYNKMGKSASGVACDLSGGKFGPFQDQLFVCDQTHSTVMRVDLEKVQGYYQGACFPFRKGFGSGNVPITQAPDGSMFVGGTARGWGSVGNRPYALERLVWTGRTPFEIHSMRARPDGFELRFTEPVDRETAARVDAYTLETYTYIYQSNYGSPEVDHTRPTIKSADVSGDARRVRLRIDGLQIGHVHELKAPGVRSAGGASLLHPVAYYTLFWLPDD